MPNEFPRAYRVGEQLHRELAQLIQDEVRDPRVGSVTIVDVAVSRDLAHAKVYFTVIGDDEALHASETALNRAAKFLRGELGRRIKMRGVPELRFIYDDTQQKAARVDALIDAAVRQDAERENY